MDGRHTSLVELSRAATSIGVVEEQPEEEEFSPSRHQQRSDYGQLVARGRSLGRRKTSHSDMDRSKRGREPAGGTTDSESTSLDAGSSFPDPGAPPPPDFSCESTAPGESAGAPPQGQFQRSVEERKVRAKVDDSPRSGSAQSVDVEEHIRPRSVRPSGGKDRHSKVQTAKGLRDRRVRLSVATAIQFYDVQDRLGFDQPSKAVEWLLSKAKHAIDELPPVPASPRAPSSALGVISPFPSPGAAKSGGSPSSGGMPAPAFSTRFFPGSFRSHEQAESTQQAETTSSPSVLDITKGATAASGEQVRMESRVKARERARERMKERATTTSTTTTPVSSPPSMLRPLEGVGLLPPEGFTYSSFTSLLQSPGSVHAPLSSLIQSLQSPHLYHAPPFHQQQQPGPGPSFQLQVDSSARQFQFSPSPLHVYGGPPGPSLPEFPSYSSSGFGIPSSHLVGGGVGGAAPDSSPFVLVSSSVNQYRPIPASLLEEVTYMQPRGGQALAGLGVPLQYEPFQASYDFVSALDSDRGGGGGGGVSSSRLSAAPGVYQTGYQTQGVIQELEEESLGGAGEPPKRNNQSTSS